MAAEFTVNVEHALEMEHMAGIGRIAAAKTANADAADANLGSITGDECAASMADGGIGHHLGRGPGGGVENDVVSVGTPDDNSPESLAAAAGEEKEELKTMEALVHEARLERARQEGGSSGGRGGSVEKLGIAGRGKTRSSASLRDLGIGTDSHGTDDDRNPNREGRGARACFDVLPIVRQADLNGDALLSTFSRIDTTAVAGGTTHVISPATLPSLGTATYGGSMTDTSRSAPSSPRARHPCSAAATTAAAGSILSVASGSLSPVVPSRGRASTVTGCCDGVQTVDSTSGDINAEARSSFTADGGGGMGGESDGSVFSSTRPAVEYERDGRAKLPRFTSDHIASVLRGQTLGLEQQLEAPNEDSLDDTVARASRISLQCKAVLTPRVGAALDGGFSAMQEKESGTMEASSGEEEGHSVPVSQSAVTKAGGSWKQLVFACLLLLFAGDGLRHRWKSLFHGERAPARRPPSRPSPPATAASRQASFGAETASNIGGDGGGPGHKHVFGTAFLPPTCQDPASGRTMAVWATPSGPCLSPVLTADNTESMGGPGGPGCASSFRLCSITEVDVRDTGDVKHHGRPQRGEEL